MSSDSPAVTESGRGFFWRRTGAVFAVGLVGVLTLAGTLALAPETLPILPALPLELFLVATVVQPAIFVLIAAALGARLATAVGLRSHVAARAGGTTLERPLRGDLTVMVALGLGVGLAIVGLDVLFAVVGDVLPPDAGPTSLATVLTSVPYRFLYGGLTEEVLLRWGFMTLLVWLGWRWTGRPTSPPPALVWVAIVVAAVLFGIGHLPAAAELTALTPASVARVVLLNTVGGIAFGWAYWRYSLEAAMVAHAATHVVLVAGAIASLL